MRSSFKPLGEFRRIVDERNSELITNSVLGINIDKYFMPSVANIVGTDLSKYKLLRYGRFACNPMHVGRDGRLPVARYTEEFPALVSPAYFMFEISAHTEIDPEYLMLCFRRPDFDRMCAYKADASVRGGITWDDICALTIPVPPIEEQRKIVRDYQVITDRIALLRKINENLINLCCTNYLAMLSGLTEESSIDELPDGWSIGNIGSYCDLKSGYAFKSEWWTDKGYKVIKIANITSNTIDLDSCDCVMEEHAKFAKSFYSIPGDIFIAMTGATIGKIGILPICNDNVVVNQRVGKFYLGENPILKAPFLFATLLSSRVARRLQPEGMAGSAQDNLSADDILNISIILPDSNTIAKFNQENRCIIEYIITNMAELRDLKKLFNILSSKNNQSLKNS